MNRPAATREPVAERLRRYYTRYYRDTLGLLGWAELVENRAAEEEQEAGHLARLETLLGRPVAGMRLLNVGCGTGGFNVVAARAGAGAWGVDTDAEAVAIAQLKAGRAPGGACLAAAEVLPFASGLFDLVYCYSAIEHVASVEASVAEMVRVTRAGGIVYVHTPNAWSWYEGHYKLLWVPGLPRPLGALYLALRRRPTAYLATLRRLTKGQLRRAFRLAGVTDLQFHTGDPPRESRGPLWPLFRLYYGLLGVAPFIEITARKPA
jgi:2-polyprenyl-3-methyl-5-hydroxy-6-metoxy-1,4-benzoquinol methylase